MEKYTGIIRRYEQSFVRAKLEQYGLQPFEGLILLVVSDNELCNQETICSNIEVDKGRIAKTIGHLEEEGLLCRIVNDHNKREKLVALTPKGQEILKVFKKAMDDWCDICFIGFSESEKQCYMEFLKRISNNILTKRKGENNNGQN